MYNIILVVINVIGLDNYRQNCSLFDLFAIFDFSFEFYFSSRVIQTESKLVPSLSLVNTELWIEMLLLGDRFLSSKVLIFFWFSEPLIGWKWGCFFREATTTSSRPSALINVVDHNALGKLLIGPAYISANQKQRGIPFVLFISMTSPGVFPDIDQSDCRITVTKWRRGHVRSRIEAQ